MSSMVRSWRRRAIDSVVPGSPRSRCAALRQQRVDPVACQRPSRIEILGGNSQARREEATSQPWMACALRLPARRRPGRRARRADLRDRQGSAPASSGAPLADGLERPARKPVRQAWRCTLHSTSSGCCPVSTAGRRRLAVVRSETAWRIEPMISLTSGSTPAPLAGENAWMEGSLPRRSDCRRRSVEPYPESRGRAERLPPLAAVAPVQLLDHHQALFASTSTVKAAPQPGAESSGASARR